MRNLSDPVTLCRRGTAIFILSGLFSDSEISRVVEIGDAEVGLSVAGVCSEIESPTLTISKKL